MLELFDQEKLPFMTIIKQREAVPDGLNQDEKEVQVQLDEPVVLYVDKDGLAYISEDEQVYPVAVDYSDVLFLEHNRAAIWIRENQLFLVIMCVLRF